MNEIYEKLDVKNEIFLSFFSDNYDTYVKDIHSFLNDKKIPHYCMKNNVTHKSNLSASNNFVDDEARAIKKTNLFIDESYFNSEECKRECDMIKEEITNSIIKPKFMIFYIDINCKDNLMKQSWYLSSIHNDRNIYENLKEKSNSIELICNMILNEYQFKIVEFLNYKYCYEHLISNVVFNSLKGKYECTTVSDYILTSRELTCQKEGYELHIITDEINNYDCTTLSSMAIASNLQKKVKYIYYGSSDNLHVFNNLKEIIKGFIAKNAASRRKVDRYIRHKFEKKYNIVENIEFLNRINFNELTSILSEQKKEILQKYKTSFFKKEQFKGFENLKNWLKGESNTSYQYQYIETFFKFLKEILVGEENNERYIIKKLNDFFLCLKPLVAFSNWHIGQTRLSKNEIEELENELNIQEEIRDWIGYEEFAGQNNMEQEQIDEIIKQNMCYIIVNPCDNSPMITHSFCLFFENPAIRCAWYRTSSSIGPFTDLDIDNDLIMYNVPENEKTDFINMYYKIINSSKNIQEQLNKIGSGLYTFLREVVENK